MFNFSVLDQKKIKNLMREAGKKKTLRKKNLEIIFGKVKGLFLGKWHVFVLALLYLLGCLNEWRQHSARLQLLKNIYWQHNQVSKKNESDKMSVITFLPFRSTPFIIIFHVFERKGHDSQIFIFLSKNSFFYNLLAQIYDKMFLTRTRRSM